MSGQLPPPPSWTGCAAVLHTTTQAIKTSGKQAIATVDAQRKKRETECPCQAIGQYDFSHVGEEDHESKTCFYD